jgi:hypothetical protein
LFALALYHFLFYSPPDHRQLGSHAVPTSTGFAFAFALAIHSDVDVTTPTQRWNPIHTARKRHRVNLIIHLPAFPLSSPSNLARHVTAEEACWDAHRLAPPRQPRIVTVRRIRGLNVLNFAVDTPILCGGD